MAVSFFSDFFSQFFLEIGLILIFVCLFVCFLYMLRSLLGKQKHSKLKLMLKCFTSAVLLTRFISSI